MDRWNLPRDPLLALQQGDAGPFEALVRAHARTLVAYFRQRGASSTRAEDLSQEVFLKLHQASARYRPEERFSAFFFRVARNAWIDECRRRGTRLEPDEPRDGSAPDPVAPALDPARDLMEAEEGRSVRDFIAHLPESHREVFELAVLGELGYAEIGDLLGIPEGTVKSRMFYAVRRLRIAWEELHGTEEAS